MLLVLFDVGGVIVQTDRQRGVREIEKLGVPPDHAAQFFENDGYAEFARGKITGQAYYEYLVREVFQDLGNEALTLEAVRSAHNSHIFVCNLTVIDTIRSLRHPIALATDTNEWQMRRVSSLVELTSLGTNVQIVRSDKIGKIKRDPGSFERILLTIRKRPEDVVYIDDVVDYVERMQKIGATAFQFTDAAQLIADLRSINVL